MINAILSRLPINNSNRYVSIDWFRGLMLVIMTIDHYGGPVKDITFQTFGFVSVVEGFVFISGLVAGFVYSRHLSQGTGSLFRRTFHRAGVIYVYHIILVAVILSIALFITGGGTSRQLFIKKPLYSAMMSIVLIFQPYDDILPMYAFFLILLPFALILFRKRSHTIITLSVSFLLWIIAQAGLKSYLQEFISPAHEIRVLGYFDPFAWQFVFIFGLWLGYSVVYRENLVIPKNRIFLGICLIILTILFLVRHDLLKANEISVVATNYATSRSSLGWLRLMNFLLLLYPVWWLASSYPSLFSNRWLVLIGRHSLQVYAYQVLAVYSLRFVVRILKPESYLSAIISLLLAVSLILPAMIHERYKMQLRKSPASQTKRI